MRRAAIALGSVLAGCGGGGGSDWPDADPALAQPVFDDSRNHVEIVEGEWIGVGSPRAGVTAWFSDSPDFLTETMREGGCRVRVSDTAYCQGCEVGFCVSGVCTPYPAGRSAGTIQIDGLTIDLTLTWLDSYYSQSQQPPANLFDPGDAITVTAAGGEVPAFTAAATGVAPIRPDLTGSCDNEWHLTRGQDAELTWRDPVPGARAFLRLPSPNNGHGMPPRAVIECEGPDTGRFLIPSALIDALPDLYETDACSGVACVGVDCPPSTLARYSRATTTAGAEPVELRVQNEINFYVFD